MCPSGYVSQILVGRVLLEIIVMVSKGSFCYCRESNDLPHSTLLEFWGNYVYIVGD